RTANYETSTQAFRRASCDVRARLVRFAPALAQEPRRRSGACAGYKREPARLRASPMADLQEPCQLEDRCQIQRDGRIRDETMECRALDGKSDSSRMPRDARGKRSGDAFQGLAGNSRLPV